MGVRGVDMSYYNLKNALEFNKYTCTMCIALIPYCIFCIKSYPHALSKIIFTVCLAYLFISLLYGLLVFGKSAKVLDNTLDPKVE